jgi:hypothetical protein
MNKKRKILTVVGLVVLGVIIWLHAANEEHIRLTTLLVFGGFYAGLYALLGGESKPRNWRRIIKLSGMIIAVLVVIAGLVGAIIYVQEQDARRQREIEWAERAQTAKIEREKKEQAEKIVKEAKQREEEASKHRITRSEIDLIDLRFQRPGIAYTLPPEFTMGMGSFADVGEPDYFLYGRIRNRSAHTLNSITLKVRLYENEDSSDILGETTTRITVEVPPHQARAINWPIYFGHLPELTQPAWKYDVTEIRGSKGYQWQDDPTVKDFDPDKFLGLTPTPKPKRDDVDAKKHGTANPFDQFDAPRSSLPNQPTPTP